MTKQLLTLLFLAAPVLAGEVPFGHADFMPTLERPVYFRHTCDYYPGATPRAWLEQGKKISVKNARTSFGPVSYEIVSDVDNGKISATVTAAPAARRSR